MELRFFDDPAAFLDVAGPSRRAAGPEHGDRGRRRADPRPARGRHRVARGRAVLVRGGARGRRGRGDGDADRAVRRLPGVPDADARRGGAAARPRRCSSAASRCSGPTARCRRSQVVLRGAWLRRTGGQARVGQHTRLFELGELVEPRAGRRAAAAGHASTSRTLVVVLVRRVHGRRRRAGRPRAGASRRTSRPTAEDMRRRIDERPGLRLGGRATTAGPRDRREPAGVRRLPDRAGLHPDGAPRPRLRQRGRRAGLDAAPRAAASGPACSPTRPTRRPTRSTRRSATGGSSTWRISAWSDGSIEWSRHERRA